MNWYKLSKLVDKKSPNDEKSIFTQCCYCKLWKTVGYSGEEWRQLNSEENIEKSQGYTSHGICPKCNEIIEKYGVIKGTELLEKSKIAT